MVGVVVQLDFLRCGTEQPGEHLADGGHDDAPVATRCAGDEERAVEGVTLAVALPGTGHLHLLDTADGADFLDDLAVACAQRDVDVVELLQHGLLVAELGECLRRSVGAYQLGCAVHGRRHVHVRDVYHRFSKSRSGSVPSL